MPTFTVHGADRKSGKPRTIEIEAPGEQQALTLAIDKGLLVSRAELKSAPPPAKPRVWSAAAGAPLDEAPSSELVELRAIRLNMKDCSDRLEQLTRSRVIRAPIGTISVSIIIGSLLTIFSLFLLYFLNHPNGH